MSHGTVHINETLFKTLIIHVTCINIYILLYDGFNKSVVSSTDSRR